MKTAFEIAMETLKQKGRDENHPLVKMLKAQQTADKNRQSSEQLYVTGSVKKG